MRIDVNAEVRSSTLRQRRGVRHGVADDRDGTFPVGRLDHELAAFATAQTKEGRRPEHAAPGILIRLATVAAA